MTDTTATTTTEVDSIRSRYLLSSMVVLDVLPDEIREAAADLVGLTITAAQAAIVDACPDPDDRESVMMLLSATAAACAVSRTSAPLTALREYATHPAPPRSDPS